MSINYVFGDATDVLDVGADPDKSTKIICHVCNDVGAWGAGFVMALSKRFGDRFVQGSPEAMYRDWATYGKHAMTNQDAMPFVLGQIQIVNVKLADDIVGFVINMLAQRDTRPQIERGYQIPMPLIRYDALQECLHRIEILARNSTKIAELHMPFIGTGLAGGDWHKIEQIIQMVFRNSDAQVYVYDFNIEKKESE